MILYLLTTEVWTFRIEYLATAFNYLYLTPQADGRNTPFSFSVAITELPWSTVICLSPLIVIVTFPLGLRYFLATSSRITNTRIVIKNTIILVVMNCPIVYLDFKTREAHHCHSHQSYCDKRNTKSLQRLWYI